MKVLIVYAHPEPASLNGAIHRFAVDRLRSAGHDVQVSDLYAMRWKAQLDADDFPQRDPSQRLHIEKQSQRAYESGTQTEDVTAEQKKLREADALILQFPLWWYSMPAILKGWVERVYAYGLAYGVGEHSLERWGERFGEGSFAGKRAMLIVTAGGWASHYSERGINGPMEDLLFPINHGILYYPGFDVLPPYVIYQTSYLDNARYQQAQSKLGESLDQLFTTEPIPYRRQNYGDYTIPSCELKPGLSPGRQGFRLHST